jgi:predicted nucleic acid-binding protein
MSGNDLALDTSAAIKLLNNAPFAASFLASAGKIYLPAIAAGELLYGARNSSRHMTNLPRYRQFIDQRAILPVSAAVSHPGSGCLDRRDGARFQPSFGYF